MYVVASIAFFRYFDVPDPSLTIDELFQALGQTLLVSAYLLRQDDLFQCEMMRTDIMSKFRERPGPGAIK